MNRKLAVGVTSRQVAVVAHTNGFWGKLNFYF